MTRIRDTLIFFTLLVLSTESYRFKRSKNEYILHKCIATAELGSPSRIEDSLRKRSDINENVNKLNTNLTIQRENKKIRPDSKEQNLDNMPLVQSQYVMPIDLKDTPLRTVNIQAAGKDKPFIFKRKNLPELEHNISGKKSEISVANVIVIKLSV